MLSMQDFREWLSSTEVTAEAYQCNLAQLTRANLTEMLNVRNDLGDLGWTFWHVDQQPTPNKSRG
jgi:hypothetical protein